MFLVNGNTGIIGYHNYREHARDFAEHLWRMEQEHLGGVPVSQRLTWTATGKLMLIRESGLQRWTGYEVIGVKRVN